MEHLINSNLSATHNANSSLAFLGGQPAFAEFLHVGRPNIGARGTLLARINDILDRRWLSNNGPLVKEFERRIANFAGVRYCVAICNATVALQIAIRALNFRGEVIVPSFTFVATAHALQWQGIEPIFCDIDPITHNIDPLMIERLITDRTTGIIGVHLWGRPCNNDAIQAVANRHGLKVMYDAAHAFACTHNDQIVGNLGECEVFSFHATKFLNSFEGGAVVTNNDILAKKIKAIRDFGYSDFDQVMCLGINGKMTEVCAAMGLTSLEAIDELVTVNHRNYECYRDGLEGLPGISIIKYPDSEKNNYQYIVVEIDPNVSPLNRDEFVAVLHAENVLARKYFWPGCHKMEPYRSNYHNINALLPVTERVAERVMVLPTGQAIEPAHIRVICGIIANAFKYSDSVRRVYSELIPKSKSGLLS